MADVRPVLARLAEQGRFAFRVALAVHVRPHAIAGGQIVTPAAQAQAELEALSIIRNTDPEIRKFIKAAIESGTVPLTQSGRTLR
jgi:hypothetical protein